MNAKQRRTIAERLAEIARRHGAVVEITDEPRWRSLRFDAAFPEVRVGLDVGDLHDGGVFAAWYGATRPLADSPVFDSVNRVHRHKASLYRDSAPQFLEAFDAACAAVADGSAFLPEVQP